MKWVILIAGRCCSRWRCSALDQQFYVSFATRILIYAMAAASLNLVLGYGGMVSFGHAAFFGAGAYVAGILIAEGITSALDRPGRRRSPPPRSRRCSSARSRCARAACTSS